MIFVCRIESRFELICVIFLDSPWWEAWIVGAVVRHGVQDEFWQNLT